MAAKREIVVGEVQKNRNDAFRVSLRSVREGRIVSIALVHRYAGGQVEVPGKAIAFRADQIGTMIEALRKAEEASLNAMVIESLTWLEDNNSDG